MNKYFSIDGGEPVDPDNGGSGHGNPPPPPPPPPENP